jgi:hypothetical protein
MLRPGDEVQSLVVPGLKTDVPFKAQFDWLSTWGLEGASMRPASVAQISIGEHDGFFVINRRIKATFEHPFLVRRADAWGFCSAELLKVGDCLIAPTSEGFGEERIDSIERIDGRVRTVAIRVPGTNTYMAEGVWTHNDASSSGPVLTNSGSPSLTTGGSVSGSSSGSSSGSGSKSSGSSFSSSSASIMPTVISSSGGSGSGSGSGSGVSETNESGAGFSIGNSAGSSHGTIGANRG